MFEPMPPALAGESRRPNRCVFAACSLLAAMTFSASANEKPKRIEEIVVSGERDTPVTEPSLRTEQLLKVPGTFGDAFAGVFALPGVVEETEGDSQPAVRGTGPEDNAFLIDYLPASYVFHDLGMSIFNEHLIRDFGLHAAGFGPEYDQATGAIFDVQLREPRIQPLTTTVDLSFLRAGLLIESQIGDNQAFYLSGRQSLVHYLIQALDGDLEEEDDLKFNRYPKWHDYQGKYAWTPNDNNRVSLLVIGSKDAAALTLGSRSDEALLDPGSTGRAELDTRFQSQGLNWDYSDDRSELHVGVGRLAEETNQAIGDGSDRFSVDSTTWTLRTDYLRTLSDKSAIRIGGQMQRAEHDYDLDLRYQSCSRFDPDCEQATGDRLQVTDSQQIDTWSGFAQYRFRPIDSLLIESGLRYSHNDYLDETKVEPRFRVSWSATEDLTLTSRYGKYHQLPFVDQIVPEFGNVDLDAPVATHYVVGGNYQLGPAWSFSADIYYKDLDKLVVNTDDASNYENAAHGEAWGVELMLERHLTDRWYGWASLSFAKSKRVNELNGQSFSADHDTPVVANVVLNYALSRWNLSARWNLRSGSPYTPITGNSENPDFPDAFLPVYGELNSKRAGTFHRLDLRAERAFELGRVTGSFYVDILNAYGANNAGGVYYEPIENSSEFRLKEEDGLPTLPSLGITLRF